MRDDEPLKKEPGSAPEKQPTAKSGWFAAFGTLEICLTVGIGLAIMIGFAEWTDSQPIERRVLEGGAVQLRENTISIVAAFGLCAVMVLFGIAVLARKTWRRLALAGGVSLFVGLLIGGLAGSRMAITDVLTFSKTGMTVASPSWTGGQIHTQLVYAEIEWLGRRETTSWKGDWSPTNYIAAWMTGRKRGLRRVVDNEYLVKQKGQPEAQLRLWWPLRNAWNEIVTAALAANVTVKPVERITLSRPPE